MASDRVPKHKRRIAAEPQVQQKENAVQNDRQSKKQSAADRDKEKQSRQQPSSGTAGGPSSENAGGWENEK